MTKGHPVFTKEELEKIYPPFANFFEDGVPREVVILDRVKEERIGKTSGKPYTAVDWTIADAKIGEKKEIKFDFNFTNAFKDHKEHMNFETSVFKVTPTKTGVSSKGYDQFDYWVEYLGEDGNAPVEVAKTEVKVEDIGF